MTPHTPGKNNPVREQARNAEKEVTERRTAEPTRDDAALMTPRASAPTTGHMPDHHQYANAEHARRNQEQRSEQAAAQRQEPGLSIDEIRARNTKTRESVQEQSLSIDEMRARNAKPERTVEDIAVDLSQNRSQSNGIER